MHTPHGWPAVRWERHEWRSLVPPELVSREVRQRHAGPYRASVTPAIARQDVKLPSETRALADKASIEIAQFDADCARVAAPLLKCEALASSRIENLTSGAKAVAVADIGEPSKRNASAIVADVHAMRAALRLADNLDVAAVLDMHRELLADAEPEHAGTWRERQVWIGGSSYAPHEAAFVAPHHERVPTAMDDLMAFVARDDIPVLVHAALAHAQFETIHPFVDGNGRTGRALMHAMLRAKGLTRGVTVPVSAGLLSDVDAYFAALTAYRDGNAVPIVEMVAEASVAALINGRMLVKELDAIRRRWDDVISARRDSVIWRVVDVLLRQPVVNSALLEDQLDSTSSTIARALRDLESAGIVTEFSGRDRKRLFQAREVLDALDDFAARVSRRGVLRASAKAARDPLTRGDPGSRAR